MTATVAVAGGGYGGTAVAKALDEIADVRLTGPRARLLGPPEPAGQEATR